MWPIIAGRRVALNFRWAQPDGALELYQAGSEGPQWWLPHPDPVRGGATAGILGRCTATRTCPKVIEHFGSAEVWALKLTPEWVGADAQEPICRCRIRCPPLLHREHHARRAARADSIPACPAWACQKPAPSCPGNNFGTGVLPANPMPHTQTVNALRVHFRNWVMKGTPPPPSRYPTLAERAACARRTRRRSAFPRCRACAPRRRSRGFIMPVHDYDWGPQFNAQSMARASRRTAPPPIRQVAEDAGAEGQRRRQRSRRRAGGAARCAARHLSRLEHHAAGALLFTRARSATTPAA